MDEIVWSSRLSTGDHRLDNQHRDLIDKLRGLEEAIRAGETVPVLLDAFAFLDTYMRDHFQDEEAEMERIQCPEADLNKRGHRRFLVTIQALNERLVADGPSEALAQEVHHELAEWFLHHILLIDVRMARFVSRKSGFVEPG